MFVNLILKVCNKTNLQNFTLPIMTKKKNIRKYHTKIADPLKNKTVNDHISSGLFNSINSAPLPADLFPSTEQGYILEDEDREMSFMRYILCMDDIISEYLVKNIIFKESDVEKVKVVLKQIEGIQQESSDALRTPIITGTSAGWTPSMIVTILRAKIECVLRGNFSVNITQDSAHRKRSSSTTSAKEKNSSQPFEVNNDIRMFPLLVQSGILCYNKQVSSLTLCELKISLLRLGEQWRRLIINTDKPHVWLKQLQDYIESLNARFSALLTGRYTRVVMDEPNTSLLIESKPGENPQFSLGPLIICKFGEALMHMARSVNFINHIMEGGSFPVAPATSGGWSKMSAKVREWVVGTSAKAVAAESSTCKDISARAELISLRPGEIDSYYVRKLRDPVTADVVSDLSGIITESRSSSSKDYYEEYIKYFALQELLLHSDVSISNSAAIKVIRADFERSCSWKWDEEVVISEVAWWKSATQHEKIKQQDPFMVEIMGMYFLRSSEYIFAKCANIYECFAMWCVLYLRIREKDKCVRIVDGGKAYQVLLLVKMWLDAELRDDEGMLDWFETQDFNENDDLIFNFRNDITSKTQNVPANMWELSEV